MATYAVEVDHLTYKFPHEEKAALTDISLQIPWHTRTLLIGTNGAGKSTILKLLSGKHLCLNGRIRVNGLDPFNPTSMSRQRGMTLDDEGKEITEDINITTYLGTEWCHMSIIDRDIGVLELLESVGLKHFQERGDRLCKILEIDTNWRMHRLSDGQKRRVQLVMGLLKPWRVLLLDEVTVDLDVIARSRLLEFLKQETEVRRCSVIYATHIFDGLAQWPDRIIHIKDGRLLEDIDYNTDIQFVNEPNADTNGEVKFDGKLVQISRVNSLHPLALTWLTRDN